MKNKHIISLIFSLCLLVGNPLYADNLEESAILYNEAIDLYKQDDLDRSIELFQRSINLNPDFYEAHYNLAQILMSVGKNEEALKPLKEIIRIRPDDSETLYNIGKIQYKRGYLSDAHKHLTKISSTAPQYESAKILINKIEKRQKELELEAKIKENKSQIDEKGGTVGLELYEIQAPSGVATDDRGNIFVASFSENTIYKISIYGQKTVIAKSGLIKGPIGITTDRENNIYVANYSSNNIVKISPEGNMSIFAKIQKPYCLTYDGAHDRIYVTEQETNKLYKFDL